MLLLTFFGCDSIQFQPPRDEVRPTPTETRPPVSIGRNRNAEALVAAKSTVGRSQYGFAPLLLLDETRLVITETATGDEVVEMRYPRQPADPTGWVSVDSFVLAYAVREQLVNSEAVVGATVGHFRVAALVDSQDEGLNHYAVWVDFDDGSGTVVDLTNLAPDFGAYHPPNRVLMYEADINEQFAQWQQGVLLNELQPLLVAQLSNDLYYLLTKVVILPDSYLFTLQAHLVQPASHTEQMRLTRGGRLELTVNRQDFAELQTLIADRGQDVFVEQPEMWQRYGDDGYDITNVLEGNLPLLWHLVTKFELNE